MTLRLLNKHLMTLVYCTSVAMVIMYTLWLYWLGQYRELVTPMFITLVLLATLLMHCGQQVPAIMAHLMLFASTAALVLSPLYLDSPMSLIWLGMPAAVGFLLLPLWVAMGFNSLFLLLCWWLSPDGLPGECILSYVVLLLLSALPPWEHIHRRDLLKATDPSDNECEAHHLEAFKQLLSDEFERAATLNKRLAVLILHLPQLEMAEEQFGPRAKVEMLGVLCREVRSSCRDHDLLGRANVATFWLVLPDTTESGALLVRERLQQALSHQVLVQTGPVEADITMCVPGHKESFARYIQRLESRTSATLLNL